MAGSPPAGRSVNQTAAENRVQLVMLIDRDGIRLMGERKGQQATSQARQLR